MHTHGMRITVMTCACCRLGVLHHLVQQSYTRPKCTVVGRNLVDEVLRPLPETDYNLACKIALFVAFEQDCAILHMLALLEARHSVCHLCCEFIVGSILNIQDILQVR